MQYRVYSLVHEYYGQDNTKKKMTQYTHALIQRFSTYRLQSKFGSQSYSDWVTKQAFLNLQVTIKIWVTKLFWLGYEMIIWTLI
jgi:hypothetical protein